MHTPVTTPDLVRDDVRPSTDAPAAAPASRRPGRAWALAGSAAALASAIGVNLTAANPVYDRDGVTEQSAIDGLAQMEGAITAFHALCTASALLLLVFGAGLYRRLRAATDRDSLLPAVAAGGIAVTSAVTLVGTGLVTEVISGPPVEGAMALVFGHWIGTIPWVWAAVGVSAVAVALAGRGRRVPRWIAGLSAVLGVITLGFGLSPLQYMAEMTGAIWMLAAGLGLAFGDKAHRQSR